MSQKPETKFSAALHRKLDASITCIKMNNRFVSGVPDWYYEAPNAKVAWAEHKQQAKPFSKPQEVSSLTALQFASLVRSHKNGIPSMLIIGVGPGFGRNGFPNAYVLYYPFTFDNQPLLTLEEARSELQRHLVTCNS